MAKGVLVWVLRRGNGVGELKQTIGDVTVSSKLKNLGTGGNRGIKL
jgi:hypothetical protein